MYVHRGKVHITFTDCSQEEIERLLSLLDSIGLTEGYDVDISGEEGKKLVTLVLGFRANTLLARGTNIIAETIRNVIGLTRGPTPADRPKPVHRDMSFEEKLRTPMSQIE